mmetsp:Transcript_107157/g.190386  ORF Transcript_107157/g.190386 Transcript_107157/m.190386 type:complete len:86 (+) Transcript_107157:350-607(+)
MVVVDVVANNLADFAGHGRASSSKDCHHESKCSTKSQRAESLVSLTAAAPTAAPAIAPAVLHEGAQAQVILAMGCEAGATKQLAP